jgi:hypothetical protein
MAESPQKKVIIGGGSGMIGREISRQLVERGFEPHWLTRSPSADDPYTSHYWDPSSKKLDPSILEGAFAVINLSGAGIADKRWTEERKRILRDSRVKPNHLLLKTIADLENKPTCFISASAIGIYGDRGNEIMVEESGPANDFVANLVKEWESSALEPNLAHLRQVVFRIGLVLSRQGGFLENFEKPMRLGAAPYFGDGNQQLSWIHIEDVARAFVKAIEDDNMDGAYNLVAPAPVDIKTFVSHLQKHLKNFSLKFPVPGVFIKVAFGELSTAILASTRVSSKKLQLAGFDWKYASLEKALRALYQV